MTSEASELCLPSERRTAAEVSSQELSMPRIHSVMRSSGLLGFVQKALDECAVHRRVPIVISHQPPQDDPVPGHEEAFRHAGCLVNLSHLGTAILKQIEAETQLLPKFPDNIGVTLVYAHRC